MLQTSQPSHVEISLPWLVDTLQQQGCLGAKDANFLLSHRQQKDRHNLHPLEIIARHGFKHQQNHQQILDLDWLSQWLADQATRPLFQIDPLKIDVDTVTAVMSFNFAERHRILAVQVDNEQVLIATAQPFLNDWQSGLAQTMPNKRIETVVANPADIRRYTLEFYNLARSVSGASDNSDYKTSAIGNFEQLFRLGEMQSPDANDQHIVKIVDWLLQYAFDQRASDIHLEPRRTSASVRFRIDGVLHDVYELPAAVMTAVVSRIKILGRLDVAEKRRPQDGRLKTAAQDGSEVELRLSTLPTAFGEKLVMRVFDPELLVRTPQEMGLSNQDYQRWQTMVTQANGIVLVTGPTGSGKTTTLYSTLKQLATREVNVCTVEDPIEMIEPAFNQVHVQDAVGLSFAASIKTLLRQDPDIIMVGEIRDLATANMAIQAALTGHLVISTLHTNDAPSAITRLLDLGVAPYLLSATLLGVMAQRLVRTLCPHCKADAPVDAELWQSLILPWQHEPPAMVKQPQGCLACRKTGYLGRTGIYEVMPLSQALKDMLSQGAAISAIRKQAIKEGMRSLRINGANKVAAGLTTLEEVLRVAPQVRF